MDFFSKIGDITKNIGDKTVDAFQTGKQHVKITAKEFELDKVYQKLGAYIYGKRNAGMELDAEAEAICQEADVYVEAIRLAKEEIERIKNDEE